MDARRRHSCSNGTVCSRGCCASNPAGEWSQNFETKESVSAKSKCSQETAATSDLKSNLGWFPVLASLLHIRPPLHRGDGSHGCGKAHDYRGIFIRTTIFCYTLIRFMFFTRARCFQLQFQRWSRPPLPRSTSCQWPQASSNWNKISLKGTQPWRSS